MKSLGSHVTKGLLVGTRLLCHDNSGAREIQIIGVLRNNTTRKRVPSAGVGNLIIASVKKGNPDMVKKIVRAIVIRQKKEFRRPNGLRISFEDNAAVLITEDGLPVGTEIKGVVAKEVAERYPKVAAISPGVI
ncbi:MAG TPA: 50S ribosomal protein L14 [Candidatus Bilamarchaeaceae archaeon]|nr:50S ribosomal protein L14 [Candidatus Bilamarchaeaceae archaeon]